MKVVIEAMLQINSNIVKKLLALEQWSYLMQN